MNAMKRVLLCGVLLGLVVCGALVRALQDPVVTPLVLSRGTFEPFKVGTAAVSEIDFSAKAKTDVDIVVRQHTYDPQASTGWHKHPGPVFVTVVEGTLTFYESDDRTCTPKVVTQGQGYVDSGRGHIARNETGLEARDISVILAPVGGSFRTNTDPNPNCPFLN